MIKKKKSIFKKIFCIFNKTPQNYETDTLKEKEDNEKLIEALESGTTGDKDWNQ